MVKIERGKTIFESSAQTLVNTINCVGVMGKGLALEFKNRYPAMFDKYNSMANTYTDDSDEWKIFEKKYELLEKYIEQYEETYDLLRDEEEAYQDLLRQRIDLK